MPLLSSLFSCLFYLTSFNSTFNKIFKYLCALVSCKCVILCGSRSVDLVVGLLRIYPYILLFSF